MMTPWEAQTLAISSSATTYETVSAPAPPHRSGTAMPINPSSPIFLTVSCGKRQSRSISAAIGRISPWANSRAVAWISSCSSVSFSCMILFFEKSLELFGQLRHHLEEVADDAVVGDLEDRRLGVLVDGHDHLGGAHAGQVLDGARDTEAQVELGRDRTAGLADLEAMRPPAGIDGGARGAHGGADHAPHLLEDHVVLGALHAAPARDHDLGLGQLGQARRGLFAPLDELHLRGRDRGRHPLDRRRAAGLRAAAPPSRRDTARARRSPAATPSWRPTRRAA